MLRVAGLLIALIACISLGAQAASLPAKANLCSACHGSQGQGSDGLYPRLAGQPADYLYRQLENFSNGARKNSVMAAIAGQLTAGDMHSLATYFSSLQVAFVPQTSAKLTVTELALGRELVTLGDWAHGVPACASCHAPDLGGVAPQIPGLAGQPVQYLGAALQRLKTSDDSNLAAATMQKVSRGLSADDIQAVAAYIGSLKAGEQPVVTRPVFDVDYHPVAQSPAAFTPPPLSAIPTGPDGDAIWQGLQLFKHTRALASDYVGNDLNCVNCHVDLGRQAGSAPMWAAYVAYPKYRSKNHKVNTLEERIQGCFRYSMNGKPPAADSAGMKALVAYFHWLATGLPVGITPKGAGYPKLPDPPEKASVERGAKVYAANCAICHADNGEGRNVRHAQVFPPLWGPRSYNAGAGMSNIRMAAAFIHANMPYGRGRQLTLQEAWDVAAYMDGQPRPPDPRK
ncbi:MAG TPA: c-type cytochrome [Gammaproteobacteria bacterium]|nr:c-type cytochrome [Gammaproteobacteria bacterium]